MSDTVFRSTGTPPPVTTATPGPEPEPNERGATPDVGVEEPLEGAAVESALLTALGVDDPTGIPDEDSAYLNDASEYILGLVRQRGATPTESSIKRAIDSLKEDLELDPSAEPSVILKRIGGLVSSWKEISFIRDAGERRRLFMKLARMSDSEQIDRAIMEEMERRRIWQ